MNAPASAIFDYPPAELIGQPLSRLLPGAVPAAHDDQWTEFWKNPHRAAMIAVRAIAGIRQDGVMVPLEISLSVFDDGTTRYVIASIVDVTERLRPRGSPGGGDEHAPGLPAARRRRGHPARHVDPDAIDDAIVDGLRQIGEALQLDCAGCGAGVQTKRAPPASALGSAFVAGLPSRFRLPRSRSWLASLKAGESCCFATVDDLPIPIARRFVAADSDPAPWCLWRQRETVNGH